MGQRADDPAWIFTPPSDHYQPAGSSLLLDEKYHRHCPAAAGIANIILSVAWAQGVACLGSAGCEYTRRHINHLYFGGCGVLVPTTSQITPTRAASSQTPLGSYTFQLGDSSGEQTTNLAQLLPFSQVLNLRGRTVTLRYWIWANQPVEIRSPLLRDDQQYYSELIEVTPKPTFHAFTAKIAGSTHHLQIILAGPNKPGDLIFIDGLVLVKGDFTASGSPVLADAGGQHGTWGGKSFENPIRNASAEQAWPRQRAFIQRLLKKISLSNPI